MCGIYGFLSIEPLPSKINKLQIMGNTLQHRGPDQKGKYVDNEIALGIQRLSVIDPDKGNQPIFSNNKSLVIVHNGEVYNYKTLRKELEYKGYYFETNTDTEVIVNLYQEKGADCLQYLNGMFAFAIYNIENKELFIARDRFGIKPLYFYNGNNNKFIFSSELKGITVLDDFDLNISFDAIDLYLTMESIPAPFTIYDDVYKLEQGHYLQLKKGSVEKKKWYELSYQPKLNYSNELDYIEELDGLIDESVRKRTISDVPLGAFLSGGLDSSLITHYLNKYHNNLNTFSIGFEDVSFDESKYSRAVSNHLCTSHHEEIFSTDSMLDLLPNLWNNMDEPFADPSFLPTFILSKFTKNEVTVSLSGDGGDEIFGGYPTYFAHKIAEWIPPWSVSSLQYFASVLPTNYNNISFDFKVKQFCKGLSYKNGLRHQYWLGSFDKQQKDELFLNPFLDRLTKKNNLSYLINQTMDHEFEGPKWEKYMNQDMKFYLQDNMLVKVDRASMAHSLEVRVPYLDHNVVEFMGRVPANLKYRGRTSKYLLKKMGLKYLPSEIVNRPKKGFGIPIAKWICGPLKKQFQNVILDPNSNINKLFNQKYNIKILNDHFNHRSDNRKLLWTLFCLENWLRINKGN